MHHKHLSHSLSSVNAFVSVMQDSFLGISCDVKGRFFVTDAPDSLHNCPRDSPKGSDASHSVHLRDRHCSPSKSDACEREREAQTPTVDPDL